MAKKVTGNIWIDQFTEFAEIITKTRYVASIVYMKKGGELYAKSIADYQQIYFQLNNGIQLDGYEETIFAPNQIYPQIHDIRKTKVEIFMSYDHNLTMINMHPEHTGVTTTIMTSDTKVGIKSKEEVTRNLVLNMYTGSSGKFYLPDFYDFIKSDDKIISLSEVEQQKFFDKGAVYLNLDNDDFIVSRESFPLLTNNTLDFGYRIIDNNSHDKFRE